MAVWSGGRRAVGDGILLLQAQAAAMEADDDVPRGSKRLRTSSMGGVGAGGPGSDDEDDAAAMVAATLEVLTLLTLPFLLPLLPQCCFCFACGVLCKYGLCPGLAAAPSCPVSASMHVGIR